MSGRYSRVANQERVIIAQGEPEAWRLILRHSRLSPGDGNCNPAPPSTKDLKERLGTFGLAISSQRLRSGRIRATVVFQTTFCRAVYSDVTPTMPAGIGGYGYAYLLDEFTPGGVGVLCGPRVVSKTSPPQLSTT